MEQIKLLWDFRGPNAAPIAQHHAIHLEDFAKLEQLSHYKVGTEIVTDMHHIAYLIVEKKHMDDLRARLKPTRGQRYNPY
ncbi:hypothetical protein [Cochleicola gelatinilyticus]|uniref:Uncharacterized protein n=1 Tax=Cochleicola gelatinilyticus TaxID=1763537 RepID=A0A167EMN0_9FLAO|nr:hypothetical protein [Cochleicola gelatinilyticus]OAB75689.1 hypothetical protein ULVI_14520 [Cochleicola gelatinilyticus]